MAKRKRFDSLLRRGRPCLAAFLVAGLMTLILLAALAESGRAQNAGVGSHPPAAEPLQEDGRLLADREGTYPAQLTGSTGAVRPSRFGPQRNDPAEGIPDHAYSPFDERNNREHPCPPGGCDYVPGSLVIKFEPQVQLHARQTDQLTGVTAMDSGLQAAGIEALAPVFPGASQPAPMAMHRTPSGNLEPLPDLTRWYKAELSEKEADVYSAVEALAETPGIAWAEPDYLRRASAEPATLYRTPAAPAVLPGPSSDPLYNQQWHLTAANVPQAWAYLEGQGLPPGGSSDIVVAIIDSGIDYTHPDLAANMWVNAQEFSGSPGVDDDGNGFVDDIHGVNVVGAHSGDPMDDHGHGTHVAGIIGAQAHNGLGGVGVAYNVKLMGIKAAQYSGVLATTDIAEGLYYAVEQGADVINMSFGGYAHSQVEEDALAVAYGQAVLVAAAGNDAKVNLPCPLGRDFYPAAYNWVLGVMASDNGGSRASFSNYDCVPRDTHEYELMAPGVNVWGTLPPTNYAAWDGTSMAAPVVSGIAALARTQWNDKEVYSSRFIMGQIAANAAPASNGMIADGFSTLAVAPQPELSYLEHWLFDRTDQNPDNDADGIVDAGETVDLGIVIHNYWGKGNPVTVTLEARAIGAPLTDPFVTMITDTVPYGAIGSFAHDDNGLLYDAEGRITGVQHPFRFSVDANTPNDHVIPFLLTMTSGNGLDPTDPGAPYIMQSRFYVIVQRGQVLPRIISEDMTLSNDHFWIIDKPVLIESGAIVSVTEGTQIQWGSDIPLDPYSDPQSPYLQVEGQLLVSGTLESPVELFASDIFEDPRNPSFPRANTRIFNLGSTHISYCRIRRPELGDANNLSKGVNSIDHSEFFGDGFNSMPFTGARGLILNAKESIRRSNIHAKSFSYYVYGFSAPEIHSSLVNSTEYQYDLRIRVNEVSLVNSVVLQDPQNSARTILEFWGDSSATSIYHNALLSGYWNPNKDDWMLIQHKRDYEVAIPENYWGTASPVLIDNVIYDYYDDFNLGEISYQPILTEPVSSTYPFVTDLTIATAVDPDASVVGAEPITFTVTYNRDMDVTVQPAVSFGPDTPETDYTIHPIDGGWQDPHTWTGSFNVTPVTGDGYQLMRIKGGRAADDHWLVAGDDVARFRFEIITSGTSAMNLQANGGEGYVDLSWTQDDFDLLAGFNMYRSTSSDGTYTRINDGIIPPDQLTYQDTNVNPGQPYYYKFTIVKTDMSETDFSNVAAATPIDTIAPVISHTPVATAPPGLPLTLTADVTDNVIVQEVTLHYRAQGAGSYTTAAMVHTTGDRYAATIPGSAVTAPGVDYYISADDGISTVQDGRPENPHVVTVDNNPVVTGITPDSGPASGGTVVTISGSNFESGATVTLGGAVCGGPVVTVPNQIACTTPAHFPAQVDVTVTNPGGESGSLLNGFTFQSETVSLSLPDTGGAQFAGVQVPLNAANVQGLAAADLTITFDPAVLTATGAATGSLTPGWSLAANTATPGEIRLAMASPGGTVSGSGVLANLAFDVAGAPGSSSALQVTTASLNDGAIAVDTAGGSFNVDQVYAISGLTSFWNGGALPGVTLNLEGDRLYTGTSAGDGSYAIAGAAADDYILTPQKSDDTEGISAFDASLALQHAAGLSTLSGHAATAADVNKNGAISSFDAYYILQKSVELITLPFPGAGVVWDFAPQTRSYLNLNSDQTGQDFSGILLGDASGNWAPAAQQAHAAESTTLSAGQANLTLTHAAALAGHSTATALKIDAVSGTVYAADLIIIYDETVLSPASVALGTLVSDWSMAANTTVPGVLRIGLAGSSPVSENGELLNLQFTAVGPAGTHSKLQLAQGNLNEGAFAITADDGRIDIVSAIQTLNLQPGWNIVSSFVAPQDDSVAAILAAPELVLCKDGEGHVYWPALQIDTVGSWQVENGYQCYVEAATTVSLAGSQIAPQSQPITLAQGWNLVAYLRDTPLAIDQAVTTISSQLLLAKNKDGQVFWPAYNINQIGDMEPGQGYQVYVSEQGTLLYPAN